MAEPKADLERFLEAQADAWPAALAELEAGAKRGHWMWFVFPQIRGLGHSSTAQFYAIRNRAEAKAYLAHPLLGARLAEAAQAMLKWAGKRSAEAILGPVDGLKFKSSMTLFAAVSGDADPYAQALDSFYDGERDEATLERLGTGA